MVRKYYRVHLSIILGLLLKDTVMSRHETGISQFLTSFSHNSVVNRLFRSSLKETSRFATR